MKPELEEALDRLVALLFLLWGLLALIALLSCSGCQSTAEALMLLPEGYWEATERLVIAVLTDCWTAVQWVAMALPVFI